MLAPIVLFVYNRPSHTLQTLQALSQNRLADQSILYVFADGPKEGSDEQTRLNIKQARDIVRSKQWCKDVKIVERNNNLGLADSVLTGVTDVISQYGKIIVLEDDLVASKFYLQYMNDGLQLFENEKEVGSICGYWDPIVKVKNGVDYFILNGGDCWGWGTWNDRWRLFIHDPIEIKNRLVNEKKADIFDYGKMMEMLEAQIQGTINSWHIRWQGTLVLNEKFSVFPKQSFIDNIGTDGTGTHGDRQNNSRVRLSSYSKKLSSSFSELKVQQPEIEREIRKQFLELNRTGRSNNNQRPNLSKIRNFLSAIMDRFES